MDYRQLPVDQLNSNIPNGRGMIKWAPFATMPEQFENVKQLMDDQTKIERPELSDDRLSEMEFTFQKALNEQRAVRIFYFYDGSRFSVDLEVIKIDQWSLMLIGQKCGQEDLIFVPFIDILDIILIDKY